MELNKEIIDANFTKFGTQLLKQSRAMMIDILDSLVVSMISVDDEKKDAIKPHPIAVSALIKLAGAFRDTTATIFSDVSFNPEVLYKVEADKVQSE